MSKDFEIDLNKMKSYAHGDGPIVVVDDDLDQLDVVRECYEKSGRKNKLITIENGEAFLELIEEVRQGRMKMPAVVLLDLNMPRTSGFEALETVRNTDEFKEIPIIVIFSTSNSRRDKEKARKLNADAYFSKPSNITDYVEFFKKI